MSDLQIVKEEPTTDMNDAPSNNKPEEGISTDIVNTNSNQLSLMNHANIPPLPHLTNTRPNTNNTSSNPFGPSYTSHNKSIQPPFPPPFSTSMPPIPSLPNSFPPHSGYPSHTPFPPVPFPTNPNPIPNPMFYAPVFNQQPPMHYNSTDYNTDNNPPNSSSATPPNPSSNSNTNKSKPYAFTRGMPLNPGAYYLIPLNTPNGQSSHHNNTNGHQQHQPMTPYMPLINQTESKTDSNNHEQEHHPCDTSSPTSNNHTDSESDSNHEHHQQPFLYGSSMNAPFLNVVSPINQSQAQSSAHLPFSIPLTPTNNGSNPRDSHQFPPPPLPLPYPDMNPINGTQFSLAPIINTTQSIDQDKEEDQDKKHIIQISEEDSNKNEANTVSSFIMQQQSQPLSFPPLPTNNHMTPSNLNSSFAEAPPLLTPDRDIGSSSDQDMDIALGTMDDRIPMMHNSYYHNITPFDKPQKKQKSKTKPKRDKSLKKMTKKTRKHSKQKKVKSAHCLSPSSYQDISVHVPALNKMKLKKKRLNKAFDIPDLSDHESCITAPRSLQMEVAYSQQYPQVGFPYIFNSEAEKGKKFTCKFMDATSMIDGEPGFCDRHFGQKCHWMRHCLEKHVPTEMSQRYQCRYCNMKYAQNSSLKEHVAICHSNKPPSFRCPYCSGDITFTRWTSVLRHCRNQHPDQDDPKKTRGRVHHNRKDKRRNKKKTKDNDIMDLDDSTMPPLNIMPSVNMNISMNQMLSNNSHHPNFIAGVAILPPNLHRNSNNGVG